MRWFGSVNRWVGRGYAWCRGKWETIMVLGDDDQNRHHHHHHHHHHPTTHPNLSTSQKPNSQNYPHQFVLNWTTEAELIGKIGLINGDLFGILVWCRDTTLN